MSRGFVKEDDQEEVPLVPPRADLPIGTDNFVTEFGLVQLQEEKKNLLAEQEILDVSQEKEYRISFNHINAKLQLLNEELPPQRSSIRKNYRRMRFISAQR